MSLDKTAARQQTAGLLEKDFRDDKLGGENIYLSQKKTWDTQKKNNTLFQRETLLLHLCIYSFCCRGVIKATEAFFWSLDFNERGSGPII